MGVPAHWLILLLCTLHHLPTTSHTQWTDRLDSDPVYRAEVEGRLATSVRWPPCACPTVLV
jgi:hypothetical protein